MEKHRLPITLCGWSLGAMLALLAAHRHPEKIRHLILFSPTPSFIQRDGWLHGVAASLLTEFTKAIHDDVETALLRFIAMFNYNDVNARDNARQLSDFNIPLLEVLAGGLNILRNLDLREAVRAIQQPALLIHGRHDPLMPLAASQWLAQAMPHATLHVAEHAAHAPFLSDPAQCATWIQRWLQEASRAS
jgi:pimeloyl-[acyl-carrier protein] methyl ester esterase